MKKLVNGVEVEVSAEEAAAIQAAWDANAAAVAVPVVVSMAQARLALLDAGKLSAVQTAISALTSPDKEKAQIWWDYSAVVERQHPYVLRLAPDIGLDDAGLDALFIAARAY